jgi:glycosyltransferase involved in cell wall biosynthesis
LPARPLVFVDMLSYTGTKGGMETYTRELYRAIGESDPGMDFVALASKEGARLDLSWFPGEVIRSGISGENRFIWAWGELFASSRRATRRGADMVHCPATLGPMRTPMPTVITIHDMLYWSHPEFMVTPFYTKPVKWMERKAAANATRVITDSEQSADAIRNFLDYPADRLHVIPLAATSVRRSDIPFADREPLVIGSGQRRPYKNWESLIRALPLIPEAERPRLVLTGGGQDDPLRPVVEETGMQAWVELRGWVTEEELSDLYRRARALAFPTLVEGFGLPVVEAMASGLPVIASDIPVLREVGADAAIWIDPHDLHSIATALRSTVTAPARLEERAREGLAHAEEFTWQRVADQTLAVFRQTLG